MPAFQASTFLDIGFTKPPEQAVAYFTKKGIVPTWSWDELAADAHHRAFTVAKMAQADLLLTVQKELAKAQAQGISFKDFQDTLEPTLKARGWWGKVEQVNPKTGKPETVLAGSPWRLQNIYRTNLQSSYQAGRKAQMEQLANRRPYWEYIATVDIRTRIAHRQVNGVILPADHPFWKTNYPPNGYQCRCRARSLSERQFLARGGQQLLDKSLIQVQGWTPDPGFASDPVEAFRPDLTRYPAKLADALGKALDNPPPAAVPPQPKAARLSPTEARETVERLRRRRDKKENELGTEIYQVNNDIKADLAQLDKLQGAANAARRKELLASIEQLEKKRVNLRARYNSNDAKFKEEVHKLFYKAEPADIKTDVSGIKSRVGVADPVTVKAFKSAVKEGETWLRKVLGRGVCDGTTVKYARALTGRGSCNKITLDESRVNLRLEQSKDLVQSQWVIDPDVTRVQTVVHELAHHIENMRPDWMAKSLEFVRRRTENEALTSLADLFPGGNYDRSEVCRPDKFISPYIGKEYIWTAEMARKFTAIPGVAVGDHYGTEVLSMGLEQLYADPFELVERDPDFFEHLWQIIGGNEYGS